MAVVAIIGDDVDQLQMRNRPRRANAGAGVERLQMDLHGQEYKLRREFNFASQGDQDGGKLNVLITRS